MGTTNRPKAFAVPNDAGAILEENTDPGKGEVVTAGLAFRMQYVELDFFFRSPPQFGMSIVGHSYRLAFEPNLLWPPSSA